MRWYPDKTGRFRERPHYEADELETICEEEISSFLRERHGKVAFPVSTSDLTVLVEQHVEDLDSGCDLAEGVDGFTDFFPRRRPKVKIARRLQERYLENRLRTTLTHEYCHVRVHGFLFQLDEELQRLFDGKPEEIRSQCRRETTEGGATDWMEWQAGFGCGALLMPKSALTRVVTAVRERHSIRYSDIRVNSHAGQAMITDVVEAFQVSREAARVRLERRNLMVKEVTPSLFR